MNRKHRITRNLLFALLGGIVVNAVYLGFLYTTILHGFAAKALGPAIDFVYLHLDQNCQTIARCYIEEFGVNILLYTCWMFVLLSGIDAVRQLKRKFIR